MPSLGQFIRRGRQVTSSSRSISFHVVCLRRKHIIIWSVVDVVTAAAAAAANDDVFSLAIVVAVAQSHHDYHRGESRVQTL